jgi:hypothetical protein
LLCVPGPGLIVCSGPYATVTKKVVGVFVRFFVRASVADTIVLPS